MIDHTYGTANPAGIRATSGANATGVKATDASVISVFEHQYLSVQDFTQAADFEWLLAQELAVFSIQRKQGQWRLKVGHYIGVIVLPSGITLEILPKPIAGVPSDRASDEGHILRSRYWVQQMLSDLTAVAHRRKLPHTKNLGQLSPHLSPLSAQTPPMSHWFVTQFLQLLTAYQPTKQYQTQQRNQSMLQGKLLIKEQLRRNLHQPHLFVSEVSQLSAETLANRFIKSALHLIGQLVRSQDRYCAQSVSWSAAVMPWRQITALSLHELGQLESLYLVAKRQLDRQPLASVQRHGAQQLLDLAYWLLQVQQSSQVAGGSLSQPQSSYHHSPLRLCLLINMNQAFEQWATHRISEWFTQTTSDNSPRYQTYFQAKQVWLSDDSGQACLSMQPDLLVYDKAVAGDTRKANLSSADAAKDTVNASRASTAPHCSHVIDIKWKHLAHPRDLSASDAYQLTSYAQVYHAQQVWLVYPVTDSTRQAVALRHPSALERSEHPSLPTLWLMPFNVLTGMLNDIID